MVCPSCGSTNIRTSRRAFMTDKLHRAIGREAVRCRACRHRFYVSKSGTAVELPKAQSSRKRKSHKLSSSARRRRTRKIVTASIFALAFIIFLVFLRYITADRNISNQPPTGPVSLMEAPVISNRLPHSSA